MVWHQHWDVNADSLFAMYAIHTAHETLCFLTFSGLSDEASTKDWEKCTIPTFLFSQNLWHQELGEVFRQSSYSPTGYNTTGQWRGKKRGEKGHGKRKVRKVRKEWWQEWCPGFYLGTGKHSARHAKLMSWLCKNFDREKAETRAETGGKSSVLKSLKWDALRGITQKHTQPCPGGSLRSRWEVERSRAKIAGMPEMYVGGQDHSQGGDILGEPEPTGEP